MCKSSLIKEFTVILANVKKLFSSKLITPAFVSEHDAIYVHSLFVMTQPKALITTTQTALIPGHGGFIYAIRFIGGPILVLELQKKVHEDFTIMPTAISHFHIINGRFIGGRGVYVKALSPRRRL